MSVGSCMAFHALVWKGLTRGHLPPSVRFCTNIVMCVQVEMMQLHLCPANFRSAQGSDVAVTCLRKTVP